MNTFYQEIDSPLHRLNPLSKLVALIPILFFISFTNDPWLPLAFIVVLIGIILLVGRAPLARFMRINGPLLLMMLGFLIFYPLTIRPDLIGDSPILWRLGPINIYQIAIYYGVGVVVRAYALILLSLCFSLTTDSSDFIRALVQQWKLPYKIGYGALAAFRFVPMLQGELRLIQAAHKIRGVADQGGLLNLYARMRRYAVPLLATAIRRAERTALAMDGRAFGMFATRTYYKRFRFHARDYLFVGGFWLICLLIILLFWYLGLLGPLSWLKKL